MTLQRKTLYNVKDIGFKPVDSLFKYFFALDQLNDRIKSMFDVIKTYHAFSHPILLLQPINVIRIKSRISILQNFNDYLRVVGGNIYLEDR